MDFSFNAYVARRRVTDNAAGDFVGDAKEDTNLPDVKSWSELQHYLYARGANPLAIEAAKAVWRGYVSARNRALSLES